MTAEQSWDPFTKRGVFANKLANLVRETRLGILVRCWHNLRRRECIGAVMKQSTT